jgi:HSP20 family protein
LTTITRRNPNRALTLVRPFYRPTRLMEELETMAREMWDTWGTGTFHGTLLHSMDVYREKDALVVKAELPGIKKKDLDISLEDDVLSIKAEKKQEEVTEDTTYYSSERHFGQYFRSMSLPFHVDAEKITATFKNGLLEIRLPKAEEAKSKHIDINVR